RGNPLRSWLARFFGGLSPDQAYAYGSTGVGAARRSATRLIQAFRECDPGSTDTTASDGQAACTTQFLSDCASDPAAIIPLIPPDGTYTDHGKGRLDFSLSGDGTTAVLRMRGWLEGL